MGVLMTQCSTKIEPAPRVRATRIALWPSNKVARTVVADRRNSQATIPFALLTTARQIAPKKTGTRIRFWPDWDIFDPDATIEIDFSTMVADGLGIDAINPDFGLQVSGDGQMALTTSYRLTRIQVLRDFRSQRSAGNSRNTSNTSKASNTNGIRREPRIDTTVLIRQGAAP